MNGKGRLQLEQLAKLQLAELEVLEVSPEVLKVPLLAAEKAEEEEEERLLHQIGRAHV